MATQAQIDAKYTAFKTKWNGKRADYPTGLYKGECLSLVKRWVDVVAGATVAPPAGGWGDYYWSRFPKPLDKWFTKQTYVKGRNYPLGSMVTYSHTHHIAIWVKDNKDGTHTVFEQNADPDGSPAHTAKRSNGRITGILPIKVTPAGTIETVKPFSWFVRNSASPSGKVIGVVVAGQKYVTVKQSNGWRKINYRGQAGYVTPSAWK